MLIQVAYPDDKYDYIKETLLDKLLEEKKVLKFRRRTGWVTVGVDPIRINKKTAAYFSPERRAA